VTFSECHPERKLCWFREANAPTESKTRQRTRSCRRCREFSPRAAQKDKYLASLLSLRQQFLGVFDFSKHSLAALALAFVGLTVWKSGELDVNYAHQFFDGRPHFYPKHSLFVRRQLDSMICSMRKRRVSPVPYKQIFSLFQNCQRSKQAKSAAIGLGGRGPLDCWRP